MSVKRKIFNWAIGLFGLYITYLMIEDAYHVAVDGDQNAFVAWKLFKRGLAIVGWTLLSISFFIVDGVGTIANVFKAARRAKRIKKIKKNNGK